VNAANGRSFTPADGGVSGALRNACSEVGAEGEYQDVCGALKTWVDPEKGVCTGHEIPVTQVAPQQAGGALRRLGVQQIYHAVGPRWDREGGHPPDEHPLDEHPGEINGQNTGRCTHNLGCWLTGMWPG
jgi:hypothetical protein